MGRVTQRVHTAWPCELGHRKALVAWLGIGHSLLLCANGLRRKQSCSLVGPPFLATKFLSQSTRPLSLAESDDY